VRAFVVALLIGLVTATAGGAFAQMPIALAAAAPLDEAGRWAWHADAQTRLLARVAVWAPRIEPAGTGFVRPIAGVLSSPFGWRDISVAGNRFHGGIDLVAATGTAVVVSRGGVVTFAGWAGAYGYAVFVDHEAGWQSRYGHLSRIDVRVGDRLRQGAVLGGVGSTGASTGPHLHFEIRHEGRALDPLAFVPR
jgi:murein DD-endopeptidase MepM/ murein hydrolase activator NlpD